MKKFFTLLAMAALSISAAMATTFTFTSDANFTQTKDGITVTLAKGTGNNDPAVYSNQIRLYANNTITVSGANLTSISLSFTKQGSKDYATLAASSGSLVSGGVSTSNTDVKTDTWTGSGSSVTFTLGSSGQRIITQLVVNGDGSEGGGDNPSNPGTPDTPSNPGDLNPDFKYMEPTIVTVPSTTVQGDAYSFISNNIKVDCTKGAITDNYFSAHAGYKMTFTATKPIKGIAINGFVKKDFEATASAGSIEFISPGADTEANPVVVVKDINSTSVTLTCVKQLRCYTVEVYFEANPEATIGSNPAEGIALNFDTAEAVYESEYSEIIGEFNYSIFLYNEEDYDPYFSLDIYPAQKDNLAGTYSWDDYTLGDYTYYVYGAGDDDFTWAEGGSVTISKSGNSYTVTGSILCDNGKLYNISFSGPMPIYTDDEYYGDGEGDESGIEIRPADELGDGRMYDLMGRKVSKGYRGIYIQNGKKHISRD